MVSQKFLSLGSKHHICLRSAPSKSLQPAQVQYTFLSSPSSGFLRRHCQKTCFTSKEQVVTPSSGLHSLAAAAVSLMAVEISVALLPSSNPGVCTSSQLLSLFSTFLNAISSRMVRHPQYHLAKTLCTQFPLVCPSNLSITFLLGMRTMMFLNHVSISSSSTVYPLSNAFLILCKALQRNRFQKLR